MILTVRSGDHDRTVIVIGWRSRDAQSKARKFSGFRSGSIWPFRTTSKADLWLTQTTTLSLPFRTENWTILLTNRSAGKVAFSVLGIHSRVSPQPFVADHPRDTTYGAWYKVPPIKSIGT